MPATCPGQCNTTWRRAETDRETHGTFHELQPTWGNPLWCDGCTERFAHAVADFPRLVAEIHNQALYGTNKPRHKAPHGRPVIYAWPGQPSRLITDEIHDALTSLEDDVRQLLGYNPGPPAGREGPTITAAARVIGLHIDWITTHHPIADDPEDAPAAYLTRLHNRAVRFVGAGKVKPETKVTPCPRCGGRLFQQSADDYIECGSCGRLYSDAEYEQHTKTAAVLADQHWRKWITLTSEKVDLAG